MNKWVGRDFRRLFLPQIHLGMGYVYPPSQLALMPSYENLKDHNFIVFSYSQIRRKSHSTRIINCSSIFYSHARESKYHVKDTFYKCNVEEKYVQVSTFISLQIERLPRIYNKKFHNYIAAHNLKIWKMHSEVNVITDLIQTSTCSLGAHLSSKCLVRNKTRYMPRKYYLILLRTSRQSYLVY